MNSGRELQDVDSVLPVYSHSRSEIKSDFQLEKDDKTLARLGKKQVLKVSFKYSRLALSSNQKLAKLWLLAYNWL